MWAIPERPDVAYQVKELARGLATPTEASWIKLKRVLRYLLKTKGKVLTLRMPSSFPEALKCYSDSNWANGPGRKSTCQNTGPFEEC